MNPLRYFNPQYWAARYFVEAGADPPVEGPKLILTTDQQAVWAAMKANSDAATAGTATLDEGGAYYRYIFSSSVSALNSTSYPAFWALLRYKISGDINYAATCLSIFLPVMQVSIDKRNANLALNTYHGEEMEAAIIYDWLFDILTPEQKTTFHSAFDAYADNILGLPAYGASYGTNINDSDWTVFSYFALAFFSCAGDGATSYPRAATILSESVIKGYPTSSPKPVGGLVSSGANQSTLRNVIAYYIASWAGGEWGESPPYNLGTVPYLFLGHYGLKTKLGVDHFPEIEAWREDFALHFPHTLTPDFLARFEYNDIQASDIQNLVPHYTMALMAIAAGLEKNNSVTGPFLKAALAQFKIAQSASRYTAAPIPKFFFCYDPYASVGTWPPSVDHNSSYATGMGQLYHRTGWTANDSAVMFQSNGRPYVQHQHPISFNVQLRRKDLWAIDYAEYYGTTVPKWNTYGYAVNGMLHAGHGRMPEAYGLIGMEAASTYAYHCGATGGLYADDGGYDPKPVFLHEHTRTSLYLPSTDGTSDVVILYDRSDCEDPHDLAGYSTYNATDRARFDISGTPPKQWILHTPVSPTMGATGFSWQIGMDATLQTVEVSTLLPLTTKTIVNDAAKLAELIANGVQTASAFWVASERKYHVNMTPSVERQWDTFLNVIIAKDPTIVSSAVAISSFDGATVEGTLVKRSNHNNALALFGAAQGSPITGLPEVANKAVHDPTMLAKIAARKKLTTQYSVQYTSDTASTDVYLCDLDTAQSWVYKLDSGGNVALTVSANGVARATLGGGAGAHTLTVAPGVVVPPPPPPDPDPDPDPIPDPPPNPTPTDTNVLLTVGPTAYNIPEGATEINITIKIT